MRVIAGFHKGRTLKAVSGRETRPTTDKVKEAVFQTIGPFFSGGSCLDLFAGSGALGIEALSRGMDFAIFVDKHKKAVKTIQTNIHLLGLVDKVEVYRTDAYRALKACAKRKIQFDIIFLDPPYKKVDYTKIIGEIEKLQLLKVDGIIYCEHDPIEKITTPEQFTCMKHEQYGSSIAISIFQKGGH